METHYFRINRREYCHISDDKIFIIEGKKVKRIPIEDGLGDAWGVLSILNYLFFIFIVIYVGLATANYGEAFFKHIHNYGVMLLLVLSMIRVKKGFLTSKTPSLPRNKIKSLHIKRPTFSYPRLLVYYENPEGKILRKTIPIFYRQEAEEVLKETGLMK